ncbi:NAD-P-binding protein [Myriangium duriaei CBS 260.36]|uniref:NAD-P-binding protein n=1 Tax=Myriangium duriaei CBS 260.36 TaxID=1168546 RepID=A0A9P4IR11_9PEZI|nr:NAD-P-binding protein [Myriangium duriaei CBS 260.36]
MVRVAVAGATSGFGRVFVRVFLNTPHNKHELVVLSRNPNAELTNRGVDVRPVDYHSHDSLVKGLEGVHTVLSFVGAGALNDFERIQTNILDAAKEVGAKRFAPSELAAVSDEGIDLYAGKSAFWEVVRKSGLEYTKFCPGIFMNLFGTGTTKPPTPGSELATGEEEALGGLRPWNFIINMTAGTADMAGDGSAKMCLTETSDIARFIIAALDLKTWPEISGMRGDVKSLQELVNIAEKVQGRRFLIKENSPAAMREFANTMPEKRFYNQVRIKLTEGWGMVPDTLNKEFPEIKPVTAEEYVEKWWRGVDGLGEPAWVEPALYGFSKDE